MCYDIKAQKKSQLKYAEHYNVSEDEIKRLKEEVRRLERLFVDFHHVSGFSHPKLIIYKNTDPHKPVLATWGLIPHWAKDRNIWNNTLNARGETIFEKPAFRDAAKNKRCLIFVDGFYEHHHHNGKTYPFYIFKRNQKPITLAGLWSEWVDKSTGEVMDTFSIVTTKGNSLLSKIHNNPKLKEPRMPVILPTELEKDWLQPINDELDKQVIQELIQPFPENELDAYTVQRLRGKNAVGNVPEASEKTEYTELSGNEGS